MTTLAHRRGAGTGFSLVVGVAVCFVVLPLIGLITRITPIEVYEQLSTPMAREALLVSVVAVACAVTLIVLFGTPVAYLLARGPRGPAVQALEVLFDLPLVLPPAVAGIALLAAFGEGGLLGDRLADAGLTVPFTRVAVVLALAFIASPLYIRQAQAAFAACERDVLDSSYTSGVGPVRHFLAIELPLARRELLSGIALAGARALGEFGATIIFAGSVAGVTQTLTLAIYGSLYSDSDAAFALAIVLLVLTIVASIAARLMLRERSWEQAR